MTPWPTTDPRVEAEHRRADFITQKFVSTRVARPPAKMPGSFRLCAALSKAVGKRVRPFLSGLRHQWPLETALYAMRAFVDAY